MVVRHNTGDAGTLLRYALTITAAVTLMLSPLLADRFLAQQAPPPAPAQQQPGANGVQVGVPEGREGGRGRQGAAGRGRRGGGPALPAPRNSAGRVLLTAAAASEKGLWLPAGGVVTTPISPDIPFQPWAAALY